MWRWRTELRSSELVSELEHCNWEPELEHYSLEPEQEHCSLEQEELRNCWMLVVEDGVACEV